MAVTRNILRTWRGPRPVIRELLSEGRREDRAIAYVMVACILIFVSQWPRLAREAAGFDLATGAEAPDLQMTLTYALFAWIVVAPLLLYMLAGVTHLLAKAVGGKGSFYAARIALFWSLLATAPALLLYGLLAGFQGPVASTQIIGALWLFAFVLIWGLSLIEAEQKR